ncbi:MAG: hypothetical protein L6R40_001968 [Gallowayella cf. fulva]|nr:MAG: hypothetical protein L6R40_001968 [Xanthomendoza cf. fulva]
MSSSAMPHRHLCGPMYAQAIIDKLLQDPVTGKNLADFNNEEEDERCDGNSDRIDSDLLGERSDAYDQLSQLIYEILVRDTDRKKFERGSYRFPSNNPHDQTDRYLKILGIDALLSQRCCDFDARRFNKWFRGRLITERDSSWLQRLISDRYRILLPEFVVSKTEQFWKGLYYFVAALDLAGLAKSAVTAKLDMLAQSLEKELEIMQAMVEEDPGVATAQQRVLHAFAQDILLPEPSQTTESLCMKIE